ncbi:MAG: lipopolysaccharide heptosyltransferase II [Deltaproteobacteria bacterium RBG_16_54_11]|nr:MAG: lipopolysaccharide heptosyltransferase II [Deltaproteobacteria bacterium RBG_16_54_11]
MIAKRRRYKGIQEILVKGTNWVGDTIISFPAVHALRQHFPKASITVLTNARLAELWKANPAVDEVLPYDMPAGAGRIFGELRIARLIRQRTIDLAVIFPRSFSSALMVFLGGIPRRIGYKGEGRDLLLTERIDCTTQLLGRHRMYYYLHLVEHLGRCPSPPLPSISLNGKLQGWADGFLSRHGLKGELLIGLNPGATYGEAKCWSPERFVQLGRRIIKDYGASILIFGSSRPEEKELNAAIARGIGAGCLNLSGETSLLQLAALLRHCRLLVTNDTGTMHVAAAVGTRVAAIFGPTDPRATAPLGEGHVVIRREVSCSPCLKRLCPEDHRCMDLIEVEEVYNTVGMQLNGRASIVGASKGLKEE